MVGSDGDIDAGVIGEVVPERSDGENVEVCVVDADTVIYLGGLCALGLFSGKVKVYDLANADGGAVGMGAVLGAVLGSVGHRIYVVSLHGDINAAFALAACVILFAAGAKCQNKDKSHYHGCKSSHKNLSFGFNRSNYITVSILNPVFLKKLNKTETFFHIIQKFPPLRRL